MHLLVPAQWGGSVEHYYHFLLGYLFPVTLWLADRPGATAVVRDCGPMNPWFDVVSEDLRVIPPGTMLHRFVRGAPATVLAPSDDPESFAAAALGRFRAEVLARADIEDGDGTDSGDVTFVRRGRSHPYYARADSEQRTSGAFRRSIPNVADLAARLARTWPTQLVDTAELEPAEQIRLHTRTRVLVGQHGAGLANMLWMPTGSCVIEVLPPMPDHLRNIFRNLAAALGHRYTVLHQTQAHAAVDAEQLRACVAAAFDHPDGTVGARAVSDVRRAPRTHL